MQRLLILQHHKNFITNDAEKYIKFNCRQCNLLILVSTALNTNSLIVDDFTVDGSTITSSNDVLIDANAALF